MHSLARASAPQSNCFKGEFKVSNSSALGKADLKKLREKILDEFPNCSKKQLDRVLPAKDVDISVLKLSNGTTLYVAGEGNPPAFFDDGFGGLYPTLFTLWRLPTMMEELVTHGPVSKFLLPRDRSAGADMMLPGVIVPDEGLGAVHVGQKRCVRVEGNAMPFAVGKMIVSDADITSKGMKGKGMNVLHVYRDSLWAYGGRKVPNSGFGADQISPADDERASGSAEPIDLDEAGAAEEEEEEEDAEAEAVEPVVEMPPDELIEYCFFAALKSTCTDAELPITADKFYSHHMQPARPAGHPQLDAKKTQHKQIGKFIKAMHKAKLIKVTEVKSEIKIVSVDRASAKYVEFTAKGAGEKEKKEEAKKAAAEAAGDKGAAAGKAGGADKKEEEVVRLRTKPPVVSTVLQPNSYTKAIFEAMGKDKNGSYSPDECNRVLQGYVETKLGPPTTKCNRDGDAAAAERPSGERPSGERPSGDVWDDDDEAATEVRALLTRVGVPAAQLDKCAAALAADGYDSPKALEVAALSAAQLQSYGVGGDAAAALATALAGKLPAAVVELLQRLGLSAAEAVKAATALANDGFDSAAALRLLKPSEAAGYGVPTKLADKLVAAASDGGGAAAAPRAPVDLARVPLDDLLLESLVKVAGGAKKGTVYPSHLSLADLQARMAERMTQMYKMEVEGEAPAIKKGTIKPIKIEMKRAAGHNKTHVSGLESFLINPDAVSQLLKVKLGCTTAVLKLPGNNVKEQEIILQGHCVNEVVDYLRDAYCIDRSWIDLGKELDRKGKKIQAPTL